MKQKSFRHLLMGLAFLGTGTLAFAQTPTTAAPAPFMDPHPYQSQTSFRSKTPGINEGAIEVIPATIAASYRYHENGNEVPQVATNTAFLYDKRFLTSAQLPIIAAGGNYTFYKDGYMSTVSADGLFDYKHQTAFKPEVIGGTYFTDSGTNNLVLVDSYGFYFNTYTAAPSIRLAGGNFYIDESGVMTTIKSMGAAPGNGIGMATVKAGLDFSDAILPGGNFVLMSDGTIVTISSITGYVSAPYTPEAGPKFLGGNYFVGMDNLLYTIDSDGNLKKNSEYTVTEAPTVKAYSFMLFADGSFIFVDGVGIPHKSILRLSPTANIVQNLSVFPAAIAIDPASIYLPKN
jgi:hypothetical protein